VPLQKPNAAQTEEGISHRGNGAAHLYHHNGGFNYISYRWVVSDSALQMVALSKKRSFNWSYLVAQRLRRIRPGKFF